jgi:hypothetical protein
MTQKEQSLQMMEDEYRRLYFKGDDTVYCHLKCVFDSLPDFAFIEIFDCKKFSTFGKVFPEEQVKKIRALYGRIFDPVRFKYYLRVVFTLKHFERENVYEVQ